MPCHLPRKSTSHRWQPHSAPVTVTPAALIVRNPHADVTHATIRNGLAQEVLLRKDAGRWVWCWVWPGLRPARRGDPMPPPEIEPIGPAEDIARRTICWTTCARSRRPQDPGDNGHEHCSGRRATA